MQIFIILQALKAHFLCIPELKILKVNLLTSPDGTVEVILPQFNLDPAFTLKMCLKLPKKMFF